MGHKIAGIPSPVDHPKVVAAAEGARRKLAKTIQPKEPISEQMQLKLAERYNKPCISLETLRFLFITHRLLWFAKDKRGSFHPIMRYTNSGHTYGYFCANS